MASNDRGKDSSLEEQLLREGYRFGFFQAVKLLEMSRPGCIPVGEGIEPEKEAIKFKANVGFGFPASEIYGITESKNYLNSYEMVTNIMGLAGNLGPLPEHVTELIIERLWNKDTALRDFLDIFNHRLLSIFYRVRKIYRVGFDIVSPEKSKVAEHFFSLIGLGTPGLRGRMEVDDHALLYYSAAINQQRRSAAGLASIVTDCFKIQGRLGIRQFIGQWSDLDEGQLTVLGRNGKNRELGMDAIVGRRFWDQQGKIVIYIGPLNLREFFDFLPNRRAFKPFCQLTGFYVGGLISFDIVLVLKSCDVPKSRIGSRYKTMLGWTSWLRSGKYKGSNPEVKVTSTYNTSTH